VNTAMPCSHVASDQECHTSPTATSVLRGTGLSARHDGLAGGSLDTEGRSDTGTVAMSATISPTHAADSNDDPATQADAALRDAASRLSSGSGSS
jgi:hypothetical protein